MAPFSRHTRPSRSAWPSQVDLPQGQLSMSDDDWVRYIESCLRSADAMSGIDRAMFRFGPPIVARAEAIPPRFGGYAGSSLGRVA